MSILMPLVTEPVSVHLRNDGITKALFGSKSYPFRPRLVTNLQDSKDAEKKVRQGVAQHSFKSIESPGKGGGCGLTPGESKLPKVRFASRSHDGLVGAGDSLA